MKRRHDAPRLRSNELSWVVLLVWTHSLLPAGPSAFTSNATSAFAIRGRALNDQLLCEDELDDTGICVLYVIGPLSMHLRAQLDFTAITGWRTDLSNPQIVVPILRFPGRVCARIRSPSPSLPLKSQTPQVRFCRIYYGLFEF